MQENKMRDPFTCSLHELKIMFLPGALWRRAADGQIVAFVFFA